MIKKQIKQTALAVAIFFVLLSSAISADEKPPLLDGQWSVEKINRWYEQQKRIVGCNFLPSTAVNDIEMWQDETFDLETIDKELGWAKDWGINSVRVFLNYVVWEAEPEKLKKNFKRFLDVAEKHGISVMPILFDDCNFQGGVAKIGKQPEPRRGVHNSGWVSSPPLAMIKNSAEWSKLKSYLQDMIGTFANDKRIIIWDLYNEPGNSNMPLQDSLYKNIFAWAREMKPAQPLTIGAWRKFDGESSRLFRDISDIVSFHAYDGKEGVENKIRWAQATGRSAVCTEWLLRQNGNSPQTILPLFKENKVGGYHWGLVAGRTQTYFHWGSKEGTPEPDIWQHDLIRIDGKPYLPEERILFRKHSLGIDEKMPLLDGQWSVEKINSWYEQQKWIVGCNFLPSTAVNDVEMWQDETFDLETIDKELGWAKDWGINSVRVFLNYVVWEAEPNKLKKNIKRFLDVAEKHGISVMPVLFDDCNFSNLVPKVGKQPEPRPAGFSWVPSPSHAMIKDPSQWDKMKKYEQDIIREFANDKRIIIWDLYNEPGNSGAGNGKDKVRLVKETFAWAREVKPAQPLTIGGWSRNLNDELGRVYSESSDVVSFHSYGKRADMESRIRLLQTSGRPVICTEWLFRQNGNTPKVMLPVLKENKVGSYHWGLVAGRMLTQYLPHSKMEEADPKIWRHDLMHADGTPHQLLELILFRKLAGIKENSDETGNMIPHVGTPLLPISDNKPQTWFYTESEPPQDWMSLEFDDKNWKSGNAPFGKKEAQVDRFPQTEWNSKGIRLRHDFELTGAELKKIKQLVLLTHFDEDAVVYLNGRQIKNFAEYKYNAAYEAFALDADAVKLLRNGKNVLAVECKNTVGGQFIDVGLYAK